MNQSFIYDAIRTPRGRAKPEGGLADISPLELLSILYKEIQRRNRLDPIWVEDVILGCVSQVNEQGGNIAKASLMYAGWPDSVPGMTLNRFCSSGLDAINVGVLKILAGQASCVVTGGIEMMSRVPMLSDNAVMFSDANIALSSRMLMMGSGADLIASDYDISREMLDKLAYKSQQRAAKATREGFFKSIIPIQNPVKKRTITQDECIRGSISLEQLAALPPAFAELGNSGVDALQLSEHPHLTKIVHVHTAGNSPSMADAAALVLLGDEALQENLKKAPAARVLAVATTCNDPLQVVSGCTAATAKLMYEQNITVKDIDLFEIHEAFAATIIACQRELNIRSDKLNVNGGVIAMGHPMGATGAIMLGTLIDELTRRKLKTGIVATSGAAGIGTALLISLC
ncbi:MAG: acetyl-CoA C-acyltransferase [Proteobacteria bacterium]|nr:acetyl-CoA C-acyltransferase [Pseudomonadota bacterium]MDA1351037.1 acetyl-CoA C-acyltransferase [Pseudomonadota bacterium]